MLLYLHVPFCRQRCLYCSFYSQALGRRTVPADYVQTLIQEIRLWGMHSCAFQAMNDDQGGAATITSVFFGGGTPSLLDAADVAAILDTCASTFSIAQDAEITLEGNPESLRDTSKTKALARAGINRISMGVQSMHNDDLLGLGRIHTVADVRAARDAIRAAGIASLNLDLMWGLPGQREAAWIDNLRLVCELEPEHLSCYALTIEEGTVLGERARAGTLTLPDEETCGRMYAEGLSFLEDQGFCQYEISNYARTGCQCRHNLGYWHNENYLGAGPAAVSTLNGTRCTNPDDYGLWLAQVRKGQFTQDRERLSAHDQLLETVMLRLRMREGLPLALYHALSGREFLSDHEVLVSALRQDGLMTVENGFAALTGKGLLVSNDIVARLFETIDELDELGDGNQP